MLPHRSSLLHPSGSAPRASDRAQCAKSRSHPDRIWRCGALTLIEVMMSLFIMSTGMLMFINSFVSSRRITEGSVLHAAATSLIYGVIEQIKQLDYATQLPSYDIDPGAGDSTVNPPPYIRVRLNQSEVSWLKTVHTPAPADGSAPTPAAPTTKPSLTATAASLGAIANSLNEIPLSTVTGTAAQKIALEIWVWIDDIPDRGNDVSEVKKITLVYTYSYQEEKGTRTVRDWEVFIRTRYEQ